MKVGKVSDSIDPEVFMALKRIGGYVVGEVWNSEMIGGEVAAEYNLAKERSKRYRLDIIQLANIDTDLTWGTFSKKRGSENRIIKAGNFNPWYEGDLTLRQLLDSLEDLAEFLDSEIDKPLNSAEFLHYYSFLRGLQD